MLLAGGVVETILTRPEFLSEHPAQLARLSSSS